MKVAVVILNWNGQNFLRQFLPSVIEHSGDAEIIVADNASTDDSLEVLTKEFPQVKQIINNSNLGFAGGYNEALKKVTADYFILLNSDVEVSANWISPVIEIMENDKTMAACQPKILSFADKTSFEYAGAGGGFIDKYGYPFCRGRIFNSLEKDNGQYNDLRRIFWASGACMFVRSSAFTKVNGFDENFFAHMEEIDLCWRIQKAGFTVWYCPNSTVYHVGGGTLLKTNPRKTYLNFRNNLFMLHKNCSSSEFKKVFRVRIILDVIAAVKFLINGGGIQEMKSVWQAHHDFRKMKNSVKVEIETSELNKKQIEEVVFCKSIVIDFYLKGKKIFSELKF